MPHFPCPNTALYGAESWTLTVQLQQHISFVLPHHHPTHPWCQHASCWTILDQKWTPTKLFSIPDPIDIIRKWQFNLLGKYAHMNPAPLPCQFLTAWVSKPHCPGGQHYTLYNSYVDTLQQPCASKHVPDTGNGQSWLAPSWVEPWILETNWIWVDQVPAGSYITTCMGTILSLEMASLTTNINGTYTTYSTRTQWQMNINRKTPFLPSLVVFSIFPLSVCFLLKY
jgi:hypothetical protein